MTFDISKSEELENEKHRNSKIPIKVGRISTRVFPDLGGPARHVYQVAHAQNAINNPNVVISCKSRKHRNLQANDYIRTIPIPSPKQNASLLNLAIFSISYLLLTLVFCLYYFTKNRVNLIHAHSPALSGIAGVAVSRCLQKPLVYTVHGMDGPIFEWANGKGSYAVLICEKIILRSASYIVTIAPDYEPVVSRLAPKSRIVTIGNGVDMVEYRPPKNSKETLLSRSRLEIPDKAVSLIWIGNFNLHEKVKGLVDLIDALKLVKDRNDVEWILSVVGDGLRSGDIREHIISLNLENRIRLLGHREDISILLRGSDIFVLPSRHEGSPNSLLEAMASGVACVGSAVGAIPSILENRGHLVMPGDVVELSNAIQNLLDNKRLRLNYSRIARTYVERNCTWQSIAKSLGVIYQLSLTKK